MITASSISYMPGTRVPFVVCRSSAQAVSDQTAGAAMHICNRDSTNGIMRDLLTFVKNGTFAKNNKTSKS